MGRYSVRISDKDLDKMIKKPTYFFDYIRLFLDSTPVMKGLFEELKELRQITEEHKVFDNDLPAEGFDEWGIVYVLCKVKTYSGQIAYVSMGFVKEDKIFSSDAFPGAEVISWWYLPKEME